MFDIKSLIAKENPELLSLESKAKYKLLPDILALEDIVKLITENKEDQEDLLFTQALECLILTVAAFMNRF